MILHVLHGKKSLCLWLPAIVPLKMKTVGVFIWLIIIRLIRYIELFIYLSYCIDDKFNQKA